ncbi:hypothetical protein UNSW2_142 [Campylobacter concisus UNSW2]|uniref:Uncharacterized protein n=1 Tax=Campylobacter concisus UNSW2 TaxID=1242965 RepID=U2H2V7_9BACT|nr:hypothetical protein UNSW2_142 [Campylobacter concisus UNSW2]
MFLYLKLEVLNLFAWLFGYEFKNLNLHEFRLIKFKIYSCA